MRPDSAIFLRDRRLLGLGLDAWNNVMVVSLGIAAVAAVAVGLSTFAVIRLQKLEAADGAVALEQYKAGVAQQIAEAHARGAEADARAAKANERAAILEKEAAQARLELEKIRSAMHWRSLSDDERTALITNLKGKNIEVFVRPVAENREAEEYARELTDALMAAGCRASLGSLVPSSNRPGLSIAGPDGEGKTALMVAFKNAGMLLQVWAPPGGTRQADIHQLTIVVGATFQPR